MKKLFRKREKPSASNDGAPRHHKGGLFSKSGRRSSLDEALEELKQYYYPPPHSPLAVASRTSADLLASLPPNVLSRIFALVCPHTQDETYEAEEDSGMYRACALCGMRDLAHCVQVCRRWRSEAVKTLYHSIRLEAVHFCDREAILSEKRKRKGRFEHNADPEDTKIVRLSLLCRTLRDDPARLGPLVQFLKLPYFLRECSQPDLARIIAVLPNLRYVDLPEGVFCDSPASLTLSLEIQARCRDLRKMKFMHGAEGSLQRLAKGTIWRNLEVLDLIQISMNPLTFRASLGALSNLRALQITDSPALSDEVFGYNEMLAPFPPVEEFVIKNSLSVTVEGLAMYLARPDTRQNLRLLSLNGTGVKPWQLQRLLGSAPSLEHLSIVESVQAPLPVAAGTSNIPPLQSVSLQTFNYEISDADESNPYAGNTKSYYNYISGSLVSGGLPHLSALYVLEPTFADNLATASLAAPLPAFAEGKVARPFSGIPTSSGFSSAMPGPQSPFRTEFGPPMMDPQSPTRTGFAPASLAPPSLTAPPFQQQQQQQQRPISLNPYQPTDSLPVSHATPNPRFSSNNPFAAFLTQKNLPQTLEVFTKGSEDEVGWTAISMGSRRVDLSGPRGHARKDSASALRPSSSYGLSGAGDGDGDIAWSADAGARKSVFMGNGAGAFLAVPEASEGGGPRRKSTGDGSDPWASRLDDDASEWPRPKSSAGDGKKERKDLWR